MESIVKKRELLRLQTNPIVVVSLLCYEHFEGPLDETLTPGERRVSDITSVS